MPNLNVNVFESLGQIIQNSEDVEFINVCLSLLRDKMKINDMEETIARLNEELYKDQKRSFFGFFAENLSPEEIQSMTDKCSGRSKFLQKKIEDKKKIEELKQEEQVSLQEEENETTQDTQQEEEKKEEENS